MLTGTKTQTEVDVRKVVECFAADLSMLARITGTRSQEWVKNMQHDVTIAAIYNCLSEVDVQLRNASGVLVSAHKYKVVGRDVFGSDRPGGNDGMYDPNQRIDVILSLEDVPRFAQLKSGNFLRFSWGSGSNIQTDYPTMEKMASRQYSSNGYGWTRQSFSSR